LKRAKMSSRLKYSKRSSFPSSGLLGREQRYCLPNEINIKSIVESFIANIWTVPDEQFDFYYFEFVFGEFLRKYRLTGTIIFNESELIQEIGRNIPNQSTILPCPICNDYFFNTELPSHSELCSTIDEIVFLSETEKPIESSNNQSPPPLLTDNDIICLDDDTATSGLHNLELLDDHNLQRPPSPIRSSYPHFDLSAESTDKCPVCFMNFKESELERHARDCCERTFADTEKSGHFNVRRNSDGTESIVGRASSSSARDSYLDHPSTRPSQNRRVIKPKF